MRALARNIARDVLDAAHLFGERLRRDSPSIRVGVVYLYAETDRYPHAAASLRRVFSWHSNVKIQYVCVDNLQSGKAPKQIEHNVWKIAGDNRWWEFSGWQKGLHFLTQGETQPRVAVCVNDAFLNYAQRGLDRRHFRRAFQPAILESAEHALIGHTNAAAEEHRLLDYDVTRWVRSNFFALPFDTALEFVRPHLTEKQVDTLFDRVWRGRIFRPNDLCNDALESFLTEWITQRWRRASEPSSETWPSLRMKLIAILNERLMTALPVSAGIPLLEAPQGRWWEWPRSIKRNEVRH